MPPARLVALLQTILRRIRGGSPVASIQKRRRLNSAINRRLPLVQLTLFAVGYLWILALPSRELGQRTYHDENALQPSQVTTYWNWADVHRADRYLDALELLVARNASGPDRAQFIATEFRRLGLPAFEQSYVFDTSAGNVNGANAYAISSSPRTSGTEAIIISASWISRTGEGSGTLNLRGIATVLSLAGFLKDFSLWAKDLVFVISDGYMDGMQAWLTAYHNDAQANLRADPLTISPGVVWTALNIDYACHSFSHLGIFFEGLNGRLPNQDLINSFSTISTHTGGVPVVLYDHLDPRENPGNSAAIDLVPSWLPASIKELDGVKEYAFRARNIIRHIGYQARGRASGVHGLFHRYRIDAITIFAIPAPGPHGFHALGRVVESTLRTANNLLERLHASFFFYILVTPGAFMKIGSYLPSVILISVAMLFGGLGEYVHAGWVIDTAPQPSNEKSEDTSAVDPNAGSTNSDTKWVRIKRPVLPAIVTVLLTHVYGVMLFYVTTSRWLASHSMIPTVVFTTYVLASGLGAVVSTPRSSSSMWRTLKAFNLCLASTIISATALLNFSLAGTLAVFLGIPLTLSRPASSQVSRTIRHGAFTLLALGWLWAPKQVHQAVWNWQVLGVWFAPFVCIIYVPLVLQSSIVSTFTS